MDAISHKPMMVWQFLRRHLLRIVIGAVLAVMVYVAVSINATYQRERRIAREIKSHGGHVEFLYIGPVWMPQLVRDRLPWFDRIWCVLGLYPDVPAEMFSELGSLTNLGDLDLCGTTVTDADLEHLKGLTRLIHLDLGESQVTDAGLEHLKGLTSLELLFLDNTQVTDAGLEHLKGLTNLQGLWLDNTQVTDAGLEHIKGLTKLVRLGLEDNNIEVTPEGRAMLRQALPNCWIKPYP